MTVEITGVEITKSKVTIEAINIESIIMAEDLFEDYEAPTVKFEFDRTARNYAEMKYLYKVVQSNRRCQQAKTMGDKLEKLIGAIIQLSDSFKVEQD